MTHTQTQNRGALRIESLRDRYGKAFHIIFLSRDGRTDDMVASFAWWSEAWHYASKYARHHGFTMPPDPRGQVVRLPQKGARA